MAHDHKYIIADDQAVQVLLDKMLGGGTRHERSSSLTSLSPWILCRNVILRR